MRSAWMAGILLVGCSDTMTGNGLDATADALASDTTDVVDAARADAPIAMDARANVPDVTVTDAPADTVSPTRPLVPSIPCTDLAASVYAPPAGLPILAPEHYGDVVKCGFDQQLSASDVASQLMAKGVTGVAVATGTRIYRIGFRTTRDDGIDGYSSARVYLPVVPPAAPLPVVVIGHPSEGLGDGCATSANVNSGRELALPFAARGYAVIVPDYAGLGTPGTQGYIDQRDTARSMLDGARALRRMLPAGTFTRQIALAGYSQGGGAVLAAQALAGTYGADGDVTAVVSFAAEYQTRYNSFRFLDALNMGDALTISFGLSYSSVDTLMVYSFYENHIAAGDGAHAFRNAFSFDNSGALLAGAAATQCLIPYGAAINARIHIRDWFDPALVTSIKACATGADAGCTGDGQQFDAFVRRNIVPGDPHGAPVLYLQGQNDVIMPPEHEGSCNVGKLRGDGVDVTSCVDAPASHSDLPQRNVGYAIRWVESVLAGQPRVACPYIAVLPDCIP